MSARDPQPRTRASAKLGPIVLPRDLAQPVMSTDGESRITKHEPQGERTIVQNLGESATQYSVSGSCFHDQATKIPRLVFGGPWKLRHDSLPGNGADSVQWVYCKSTSVAPAGWRANRGNWGFEYDLELLEAETPPNGNPAHPLPLNDPATEATMQPTPRPRKSGRIGPVELHPDIDKPRVSVDSTARVKQHDPVAESSVVRWLGRDALEITIEGPCFRRHLPQLRNLTNGDRISVRTDHFTGDVAVKSVATDDEKIQWASGQWGRQYSIELIETLE